MFSFLRKREEKNSRKILKKENPLRIIMEYPIEIFQKLSSQSSTPPNYNYNYLSAHFNEMKFFRRIIPRAMKKGGKKRSRATRFVIVLSHPRLTLNAYEESRGRVVDTSPLVISRSVDRESIDRWTNAVLSHSRGPALRQQPTPSP